PQAHGQRRYPEIIDRDPLLNGVLSQRSEPPHYFWSVSATGNLNWYLNASACASRSFARSESTNASYAASYRGLNSAFTFSFSNLFFISMVTLAPIDTRLSTVS